MKWLSKGVVASILLGAAGARSEPEVAGLPPAADAAEPGGAPASASEMPALDLPVQQYRLENGLGVVMSEDHSLPLVAVEVLYFVGSGHERRGRTGFAHLFEHLMFQGSEHFNQEYFKPFEPIGGRVNGTTSRDRTNFFESVPRNFLETPLWLESDRMAHLLPALSQEKLDNQREVVKNERRQRYENTPYGMAWWHRGEALYPEGHPYRHIPIGSHEDLSQATLLDVKQFFQQYYVPSNAVLVIVGDFDPGATDHLVRRYFDEIPGGTRAPRPVAAMPETPAVHLQKPDEVPLPRVYLAWHTPALFAPGDAELDLLSNVLTGGKTSRLYKPLVYEKKVAKEVDAYQVSQALSSFYVVEATAAVGHSLDELYAELMSSLKTALSTPPSEEELARAISAYKKGFYTGIESFQPRASRLAAYYHHTGRADFLMEDLARYLQATPQKVSEAARGHLSLDRFVRLDIVPAAEGK